ncbi:MAG TPA: hypothetical protein VIF62_08510 [Labilithrix sp.]
MASPRSMSAIARSSPSSITSKLASKLTPSPTASARTDDDGRNIQK